MRRLALACLVLGCRPAPVQAPAHPPAARPEAPAAPQPEPADPRPSAPTIVERSAADDAAWTLLGGQGHLPKQTIVQRRGRLRFVSDGEVLADGGGAAAWELLSVVETAGERVRVRARARVGNLHLLVWLEVGDLAPQLARPVVLEPLTGTRKDDDGTIELAPGEAIEILARAGERARVRTSDQQLEGWIEAGALAPVFERAPFPMPAAFAELQPGAKLHVRRGGATMLVLPAEGWHHGNILENDGKGWALVEYVQPCHETVRFRGYVRAKQLKPLEPGGGGYGCGSGVGSGGPDWGELRDVPPETIAAGTALFAADGQLVARTLGDVELRRAPDGRLRIPTSWGLVPVATR